jgi:hypothetical protein
MLLKNFGADSAISGHENFITMLCSSSSDGFVSGLQDVSNQTLTYASLFFISSDASFGFFPFHW